MFYCNEDCKKIDWKIHKYECKIYKAHHEIISPESFRLILRTYLTLSRLPYKRYEYYKIPGTNPPQYRSFDNLPMDLPTKKLKEDEERIQEFEKMVEGFRLVGLVDRQKLFESWAKAVTSGFPIKNDHLKNIGVGIFALRLIFEHSCDPNTFLIFNGINREYRAIKNIASGEKITMCYVDLFKPRKDRQEEFTNIYGFTCSCRKCTDDEYGKFL